MNWPPVALANSQLYRAVLKEPKCRYPVGDGAKRVRAGVLGSSCRALVFFGWSLLLRPWRPPLPTVEWLRAHCDLHVWHTYGACREMSLPEGQAAIDAILC